MLYKIEVTVPADHPDNRANIELNRTFTFTDRAEADRFGSICIDRDYRTVETRHTVSTIETALDFIERNLRA